MIPRPAHRYPLLEVVWEDANASPSTAWKNLAELELTRTYLCLTVGFLIGETATHLHLTQSLGAIDSAVEDQQVGAITSIPKRMVRRRRRLAALPRAHRWAT